jgi:hypothetical protein
MRLGRLLRNAGVVVLALIAGLAVFVQIQQHIFRWRAERLLADMRELQSHKSTWVDAQKIMERWGAWGSYEGACAAERCEYRLIIVDTISALVWANVDRYPFLRTLSLPCMFLGEKDAFIVATLDIKNGIVEKSSYQLDFGEIFARANAVNENPTSHGISVCCIQSIGLERTAHAQAVSSLKLALLRSRAGRKYAS